jgi:hypothetical protein
MLLTYACVCVCVVLNGEVGQARSLGLRCHRHCCVCVPPHTTEPAALLCHVLFLGGRAPQKILFAKDSGRVAHLELCTVYR